MKSKKPLDRTSAHLSVKRLQARVLSLQQQLKQLEESQQALLSARKKQIVHWITKLSTALRASGVSPQRRKTQTNPVTRRAKEFIPSEVVEPHAQGAGHIVTDRNLRITLANEVTASMLQVDPASLSGSSLRSYVPPKERTALRNLARALQRGAPEQEIRTTLHTRGNRPVAVKLTATGLRDPRGAMVAIHWIVQHASLERQYLMNDDLVSFIGEHILEGRSEQEILSAVCDRFVELFGYPMVWVGLQQSGAYLSIGASSGSHAQYFRESDLRWEKDDETHPVRMALQTGTPQVLANNSSAHKWWDKVSARCGFDAALIVPLASRGTVLGVLGVCAGNADAFDDQTIQWLTTLASQIARHLLMAKDHEALRLRGAAIASAEHAVLITDRHGRIEWVNEAYSRLTGYSAQETIGRPAPFFKWNKLKGGREKLGRNRSRMPAWQREIHDRRKDGTPLMLEQVVTPLRNQAGEVTHFVAVHQDITSRKESEAKILHLAHHDPLTDLPNRVMYHDRLKQALAQAHRHGRCLAVVFLDLDNFKPINDSLGHESGDALLKIVASILTNCVRATDTVARLSGDEFTLILQDLERGPDAGHVAQKILEALNQPITLEDHVVTTTASLGIALYPFDATTPESLLSCADRAMYRAKEKGGNCYQFVSEDMNAQAFERIMLEKSLHEAWDRREFLLHYQPEVDVQTGEMTGVESLLRWQHPELGLIFPAQFLSMAQEIQLMDTIHEWAVRTVCRQSRIWQDEKVPHAPIGVNLLFGKWETEKIIAMVEAALKESKLRRGQLRIEIPQSACLSRQSDVVDLIKRLRSCGVAVVIDDFSPLPSMNQLLERLPVHTIKLCHSLVANLPQDQEGIKQIETSIALAGRCNIRVVAKGVESPEQMTCLRQLGCHCMQGYICNRPLPADEMTTLLRGWWGSEF